MHFLIAIGLAVGAVQSVQAQEAVPNGKGTIGLVCTDGAGTVFFWGTQKPAYDACVNQVVSAWVAKNASFVGDESDELIQGMDTYRMALASAKAAQDVCK